VVNGILTRKLAMAQDAPRCLAADQADRRERSSWLPVAALAQRARGLLAVAGRGAEIPTV